MNTAPDQYGVIGHPVAHSWSPFIHGVFAQATQQNLTYRLHDVPPEHFRSYVLEFFARGGRGLNVTLPHKLAAAEIANELTARADQAAAVNTLVLQEGNRILGDNTDGVGLVRDLQHNLNVAVAARRILVIGAGGATRGVLGPLLQLKPAELAIANRTPERARALADDFTDSGKVQGYGFDTLPAGPFDLIINATSAGLKGEVLAIPVTPVGRETVCYDMAYGKSETPFMRWAQQHGCKRAVQGWGMLVEQAAESFELWRGVRPDTAPVLQALQLQGVTFSTA